MGDGCLFSTLPIEEGEDEPNPEPSGKFFKATLQPKTIDKYARVISQLFA